MKLGKRSLKKFRATTGFEPVTSANTGAMTYNSRLFPNCINWSAHGEDRVITCCKTVDMCFSSAQPFLEAASLWSRLAITEQAVAADLPPGFLTSPHVVVPDLELSLKVRQKLLFI